MRKQSPETATHSNDCTKIATVVVPIGYRASIRDPYLIYLDLSYKPDRFCYVFILAYYSSKYYQSSNIQIPLMHLVPQKMICGIGYAPTSHKI